MAREEEDGRKLIDVMPIAMRDFLLSQLPFLVLSREGLFAKNLKSAVPIDCSRITLFSLVAGSPENYRTESSYVQQRLGPKLNAGEIVIFGYWGGKRTIDLFNELIKEQCGRAEKIEHMELFQLIKEADIKPIEKIGLEELLPSGSGFGAFPSELRSAIICLEPFKLRAKEKKRLKNEFRELFSIIFASIDPMDPARFLEVETPQFFLARRLLFRTAPKESNYEIIEEAKFVFDANDDFIRTLIVNASRISSDKNLLRLVGNYFSTLTILFMAPGAELRELVASREAEISQYLGLNDLPLLSQRAGLLTRALLNVRSVMFVPMMPSAFVRIEGEGSPVELSPMIEIARIERM
jgi:hypothetical protein